MLIRFHSIANHLKKRWLALFRVARSVNNVATLGARQIYILPTRWSLFYILMLLALLIGAINYTLSLAYFVTFLLAALGNIAMLHTWRNLAHCEVAVLNAKPTFAGSQAKVHIQIGSNKNRSRHAIYAHFMHNTMSVTSLLPNEKKQITLLLNTSQRGYIALPRIKLYTEFPLSLFHAWAYAECSFQLLVYPKPSNTGLPIPSTIDINTKGNHSTHQGDEDFTGHKTYQIGDLPSKVDWKASSRGIGMLSKQYSGEAANTLYLDWAQTTGDTETRIAQLTRWVVDAHEAHLKYGLTLNQQVQLTPSNTVAHYHACLKALATL